VPERRIHGHGKRAEHGAGDPAHGRDGRGFADELPADVRPPKAATASPWYEYEHAQPARNASEPRAATTGIGPDLFSAARAATSRAVDLLARSGHDPVDACLLLSLVGELRVSEIVDAPNWVVSMHVPRHYLA
jgi:formamidase